MQFKCDRCGCELAYSGTGRHPVRCKSCDKLKRAEDNRRYREANPGANYERVKKWRAENPEKRNEQNNRYRSNSETYKARHRLEVQAWNKANREKRRAQAKVQYEVKMGRLVHEPCVECGGLPVTAHHEDYNKPLEVIWLCRRCHNRLHASRRFRQPPLTSG